MTTEQLRAYLESRLIQLNRDQRAEAEINGVTFKLWELEDAYDELDFLYDKLYGQRFAQSRLYSSARPIPLPKQVTF